MKTRLFEYLIGISGCLSALVFIVASISAQSPPPGGIRLLNGYEYEERDTLGVLSASGTIYRENGLLIEFEEGMSQGYAADPADRARYAWFKERTANGGKVYVALIKKGVKSVWEPDKPRSKEFGNILLVTYPLGDIKNHAINFNAEILSDEELVDALMMILTFNPSK